MMHSDLDRLYAETNATLAGLTETQTQATPLAHPEKWSIQQIIEHLLSTYQATAPVIQARLEKRSPTRAVPSLRQRAGQFILISLGRFPHGRRAPVAVSPSLPSIPNTGDALAGIVHAELTRLGELFSEGERLFGKRRAASHIILGPLSMQQWGRFHLIHGRHHLKQIRAIRKEHLFQPNDGASD